ncbi:MAG: circularly permuted type 2 ATP-grasp protein, partial [Rhodomicrobium sp.]
VSYVVENRHLMQRAFPDLMHGFAIESVSDYGAQLGNKLMEIAPLTAADAQIVLLSPGVFNSAYFEHVFLAREIGIPLVEGRDLFVDDNKVFMKTVSGPRPVHVIYRRLNDDSLDPEVFRPDSVLGVKGLMRAVRKGTVTLANAIGTGVCDDKAVYAYLPRIIRYYLDEEPILPNVQTHICREPEGLSYTLDNLDKLVVKPVGESGGYGICVGPKATKAELDLCRDQLKANPSNYVSQPMIDLSVCPTLTNDGVEPRHVDLRAYAITGAETWLLPGGLTRVALRRGSIVVNSSQGGGTKDTWVLRED